MSKIQMITCNDGFPRRLKVAREWRGFTQAQLAKSAMLPPASISHFEAGTRAPSYESFRRICIALNVDSEYLILRSDNVHLSVHSELAKKWRRLDADEYEVIEKIIEAFAK